MGCDIHLHIEVKLNDTWHHYGAPSVSRNYRLFEKMAGVRGEIEAAIIEPRGVPDDITPITRLSLANWDGDGHSHSWFGLDEIEKLEDWCQSQGGLGTHMDLEMDILGTFLFGNGFAGIKKYPNDWTSPEKEQIKDVRFVFWFDN